MNSIEKEKIKEYRNNGLSYLAISERLNISINTIKSYCRRNCIGGVKNIGTCKVLCKNCNSVIKQKSPGKKKSFCSDKCRNIWWNSHQELIKKKAYYNKVCVYCNKEFKSYGNKDRKYCSHECYIKDRFGGIPDEC